MKNTLGAVMGAVLGTDALRSKGYQTKSLQKVAELFNNMGASNTGIDNTITNIQKMINDHIRKLQKFQTDNIAAQKEITVFEDSNNRNVIDTTYELERINKEMRQKIDDATNGETVTVITFGDTGYMVNDFIARLM